MTNGNFHNAQHSRPELEPDPQIPPIMATENVIRAKDAARIQLK